MYIIKIGYNIKEVIILISITDMYIQMLEMKMETNKKDCIFCLPRHLYQMNILYF